MRRAVDEQLQLVTSGASDWLDGSGVADGWRISGRKKSVSGSPIGDLLMTAAVDAASQIQEEAFISPPFIPLGQWSIPAAYSQSLTGVIHSPFTLFWNVKRT